MQKLIPPKGTKRKKCEMLDFTCPDDPQEDDYQNLFDNLISCQTEIDSESDLSSSDGTIHYANTAVQPEDLAIETQCQVLLH